MHISHLSIGYISNQFTVSIGYISNQNRVVPCAELMTPKHTFPSALRLLKKPRHQRSGRLSLDGSS